MKAILRVLLSGAIAKAASSLDAASTTTTTTTHPKYYDSLVDSLPSLQGKCVAITGTTSGLGYWAAVATAKKGASCLVMLNRLSNRSVRAEEEVKQQAAPGVAVVTVTCDLENITSVRVAAAQVNQLLVKYGGLDVLALNAGIMSQPDARTLDGFDVMMQTNHLSHFLLTKLLLPSLRTAAAKRGETRIVTHSSLARGTAAWFAGGGPVDAKYYVRSQAGTLGGDGGTTERYHQSKLANIAFALALHSKFGAAPQYGNFKAISAAPGWAETDLKIPKAVDHPWIENLVALSAPDGSCSLLTAMFLPAVQSGDFYEPESLTKGPPVKIISQGVALPPRFPRGWMGIDDAEVCAASTLLAVWNASEVGLGEKFVIGDPVQLMV